MSAGNGRMALRPVFTQIRLDGLRDARDADGNQVNLLATLVETGRLGGRGAGRG